MSNACQQSLKYISLHNTEGAPFPTEKRNIFLCTKIREYYTEYYRLEIARPAEALQSLSGKNSIVRRRREYARGVRGNFKI